MKKQVMKRAWKNWKSQKFNTWSECLSEAWIHVKCMVLFENRNTVLNNSLLIKTWNTVEKNTIIYVNKIKKTEKGILVTYWKHENEGKQTRIKRVQKWLPVSQIVEYAGMISVPSWLYSEMMK